MKHKYNIVFRENVIDELEKRTGKPRELLDEMIDLHYKRLNDIIMHHETPYIISIPFLGKLRMNYRLAMAYNKIFYDESVKKHIEFFRYIMKNGDDKLKNFRSPLIINQYIQLTDRPISGIYKGFYKFVAFIEQKHNEWYNKKFKKT